MRIGCDSASDAYELLRAVASWCHHDDVAPFLVPVTELLERLEEAQQAVAEIRRVSRP